MFPPLAPLSVWQYACVHHKHSLVGLSHLQISVTVGGAGQYNAVEP